jgi:hypothetical protein
MKKAKRGDLAVIAEMHRDFGPGAPLWGGVTRVGVVTSITRDGRAKAVRFVGDTAPTLLAQWERARGRTCWVGVASAAEVDIDRALEIAAAGTPFETLEQAQGALRACQIRRR